MLKLIKKLFESNKDAAPSFSFGTQAWWVRPLPNNKQSLNMTSKELIEKLKEKQQ